MRYLKPALRTAFGAAAFVLWGCVGTFGQARFERDVEVAFPLSSGCGVSATSANGSIEMTEAGRDDVLVRAHIRATTQERADAVRIVADSTSAEWLEVRAEWPTGRKSNEGVSYVIDAPGGRAARASTSNGRISVTGFSGGAEASTSNGAITVTGHDGPVDADSSNGSITLVDVSGAARARTSNGAVRVELAPGAPGPVDVGTSNGSVVIVARTGFAGQIESDTSNGSISVSDRAGVVRVLRDGRTSRLVQVGEGGVTSSVGTSNGSIQIIVED